MTIGPHGSPWTVDLARREAQRLLREVATGHDPQTAKERERAKQTIAQAAPAFCAEHGPKLKPRTREEYDGCSSCTSCLSSAN